MQRKKKRLKLKYYPRIRGNSIAIEMKENGKNRHVCSIPVEEIVEYCKINNDLEKSAEKNNKKSASATKEKEITEDESFALCPLSEPSEDEILETLEEVEDNINYKIY